MATEEAMAKLQKLVAPLVARRVLRLRKWKRYPGERPQQTYTVESIVHACRSSNSVISTWPEDILTYMAEGAQYCYLEPGEIIVYHRESYLSMGLVILLHGELEEVFPKCSVSPSHSDSFQKIRHCSVAVLCEPTVLCRDTACSLLRAQGFADVVVIPSRWLWDIVEAHITDSTSEVVLDSLRMTVAPMCENVVERVYYPTSFVVRRSWLWSLLSSGDRVKLARQIEVRAFCVGDTLFGEGDRNPYLYIIRRGTVSVIAKRDPVFEFQAGFAFGEVSVIFDEPRCCHAIASSMCEVYCLHRRHIMKRLRKKLKLCEDVVECALKRREKWLQDAKLRAQRGLAALLAEVPCLSQTTEKVRLSLAEKAKTHVIPHRRPLFCKGTRCDRLFVIGRGTVIMEGPTEVSCTRTSTEFVGELCLFPHLWPMTVTAFTSVDGWSLEACDILAALKTIHADEQALDICRQGIALYRAQHGSESIQEAKESTGGVSSSSPLLPLSSPYAKRLSSATIHTGALPKIPTPPATPRQNRDCGSHVLMGESIVRDFDWCHYALEDKVALPSMDPEEKGRSTERRRVEHLVENELCRRAGELLSLSVNHGIGEVDCDFPSEIDEVNQVLLQQTFLMPSERLPTFLQHVSSSKVTLVTDGGCEGIEDAFSDGNAADNLAEPQFVVPPSVMYTLDQTNGSTESPTPTLGDDFIYGANLLSSAAVTCPNRHSRTPEVAVVAPNLWSTVRNVEEAICSSHRSRPQSSASMWSRLTRPSSAVYNRSFRARALSSSTNHHGRRLSVSIRSMTTAVQMPPFSDTQSLGNHSNSNTYTKSNSIDYTQQAKITVAALQSALDRFVKLDDQNYFQDVVRVCLPAQTEEHWLEETSSISSSGKCDLVLLLMHIRSCSGLMLDSDMKFPIVKVSTGTRVLIRTPIMADRHKPVWPIEVASFISFIKREDEIGFVVCDAGDETKTAYTATLEASDLRENGGVGLRLLPFQSVSSEEQPGVGVERASVEVCMMAVTASKYRHLQRRAEESHEPKAMEDFSAVYLQVLGAKELKHRIEATVRVSVETDGKSEEIMRTQKVPRKTRTPAWPGQSSFCVVQSDGLVSFDLYHREMFVASYDTSVDTLAFGGTGIKVLPLVRAQGTAGEVYGNLIISVLGTKTSSGEDDATVEQSAKVLVLHVESLSLRGGFDAEFMPDPFVIVRGPKGEVVLKTSMCFGTMEATWSEERASCLILCPSLVGCTSMYSLEVYDNNESNKIGTAEMVITLNGTKRNRMQLDVGGKGSLSVVAHAFTMQDIARPQQAVCSSPMNNKPYDCMLSPVREDGYLLVIHVEGCDDLQGTGFDDFQIDPIVTARVGRKRIVVAPLISGSTSPRWSYPKATFVLPFAPDILSHIILEVWDANIELCDVLGVSRVPVLELCQTGTHRYALQPHKDQEYGRRQNLGTITVKTRFGRINSEVISQESSVFLANGTMGAGIFDTRLFHFSRDTPDLPVTRVRVHISSYCSVFTEEPFDTVKVTLSCLQHVLLEVRKNYTKEGFAAWALEEAQTVVDLRAIYGRSLLLSVSGKKKSVASPYSTMGAAQVPFSTLVSASPEQVSVRSFQILAGPIDSRSSQPNPQKSGVKTVSVDEPSITISLLALDAAHSVSAEGD
ncbi:putative nucleotide-binding protein [Trypanosoma vivax]|nr:putative nucleotide-binding protein [Trypanosoma vivax]